MIHINKTSETQYNLGVYSTNSSATVVEHQSGAEQRRAAQSGAERGRAAQSGATEWSNGAERRCREKNKTSYQWPTGQECTARLRGL